MKKFLITSAALAIFSTNAFAKTEGSYVGLSLINTELESAASLNGVKEDEGKANQFSGGVSYKYSFNFNGFFAAPELFYDLNRTKSRATDSGGTHYNSEVKNSYGVKLNLGYDITDKFAAYAIVGHSISRMKSHFSGNLSGGVDPTPENANREAFIYGLGMKYDIANNISVNFSYEISQFNLSNDVFNTTDKINPDYRVARLGVAYNF